MAAMARPGDAACLHASAAGEHAEHDGSERGAWWWSPTEWTYQTMSHERVELGR